MGAVVQSNVPAVLDVADAGRSIPKAKPAILILTGAQWRYWIDTNCSSNLETASTVHCLSEKAWSLAGAASCHQRA